MKTAEEHLIIWMNLVMKKVYHWEKTDASLISLLMEKIVWGILIPQICTDFHDWENRTCKRKLLFGTPCGMNNMLNFCCLPCLPCYFYCNFR